MNARNQMVSKIANRILTLSKNFLLLKLRYFDMAIFKLHMVPNNNILFGTDGEHLYFNERHILSMYKKDSNSVSRCFLHSLIHCLFMHPFVNSTRINHRLWNIASDIATEKIIHSLNVFNTDAYEHKRLEVFTLLSNHMRVLTAEKIYKYFIDHPSEINNINTSLFSFDNHDAWYVAAPTENSRSITKSNNSSTEDKQPKDSESNDSSTEDKRPKDSESNDSSTEDKRPKDSESNDSSTVDKRPKDSESNDSSTVDKRPKDSKSNDSSTEDKQPKDSESNDSSTEDKRPKDSKSNDSSTEDKHPKDSESNDSSTEDKRPKDSESNDSSTVDKRPKDSKSNDSSTEDKQPKDSESNDSSAEGNTNIISNSVVVQNARLEKLHHEWKKLGERTMVSASSNPFSSIGSTPGYLVTLLRDIQREKYSYKEFLKKFATFGEKMQINDDEFDYVFYTYGLNLYKKMPLIESTETKEVKRIKELVIALDTSGSTSGDLIRRFLNKTYNILKEQESFFNKIKLCIIQCDCEITEVIMITNADEIDQYITNFKVSGEGGTDFRPVFKFVDNLIEEGYFSNLKGLLYFTDGCGVFPDHMPNYKTAFIFLDHDMQVPPWAYKLLLDSDEL